MKIRSNGNVRAAAAAAEATSRVVINALLNKFLLLRFKLCILARRPKSKVRSPSTVEANARGSQYGAAQILSGCIALESLT